MDGRAVPRKRQSARPSGMDRELIPLLQRGKLPRDVDRLPRRRELLRNSFGRGAARPVAGRKGAAHREDLEHTGVEVRGNLTKLRGGQLVQLLAAAFAEPDRGAGNLVCLAERNALPHEPLRYIGR